MDVPTRSSMRLHRAVKLLSRRSRAYFIILMVGLVSFVPNLGQHGLWDVDEAHNAECAREMWEAGELVVPTFNYQLRTDKPAMLYWWIYASYSLFGVSEWSARLPSALAGLLSLIVCYEIARRLFGAMTGFLSALILASSFMFNVSSHAVTPDALLILMVQLTFLTFILAYDRQQPVWLLLTGVCAGGAMLTKGPVGIALPGAVVLLFLVWQRDSRFLWNRRTIQAGLVCALVAVPWYALVGYETKWEFLRGFFLTHNLSRFNAPMEGHQGPFFYHLLVILVAFAPWSIFLGPVLWNTLTQRRGGAEKTHSGSWLLASGSSLLRASAPLREDGKPWAYSLLLCWVGVWFMVFSVAATKLPNYVLPTYPPLAMLTGAFLVRWWRQCEFQTSVFDLRFPSWAWRTCLGCFITIGVALLIALPVVAGWVSIPPLAHRTLPDVAWLLPLALLPILAGLMTWKRWSQLQVGWGITMVLVSSIGLTAGLAAWGPVAADQERGSRALAQLLCETIDNSDGRVAIHPSYYRPSMIFYLKREVIRCVHHEQALELLQAPIKTYMVVPEKALTELLTQLASQVSVIEKRHDFTAGQSIYLITNQAGSVAVPVNMSPASGTSPAAGQ